ncbi:TonB-dependent receptor [Aerophototrophica crusticola]|uniref:TonB-dependent receptor n=1 Tax=Aerophototrophica crusticola TaxID=1709002 RepID=A0A858R6Z5_9PROT|nr:TonB-dependent receptor [Rhodospirillaceae bacterium B3]
MRTWLMAGAAMGFGLAAGSVQAQGTDSAQLEEIVVTGSRISRPELTSSSPVAVVSNEDIRLSGNVNVEQILNEMPQVVPGLTSTSNNPGNGTASVDLRGLGPQRTLVLVNGRRFVPSSQGGVVDINNIPASLVQRVEVVTGGASAVYGSDAVAGVVNFILRDDFEGAEVNAQYGITQEGDGEDYDVSATLGGNFAEGRGNAVVFANYYKRKAVFQGEREFSAFALQDDEDASGRAILSRGGSSSVLGTRLFGPLTLPNGATSSTGVGFDTAGNPSPFRIPTDLYNFAPVNYLQVPQERWALTGMARYEIAEAAELYVEANFINNQVPQQLAPSPLAEDIQVNLDNPFLSAATRQILATNFDEDGDGIADITVGRRLAELGPRISNDEYNAYRVLSGVRGDLPFGWNYDAYYSYGRVKRENRLENDAALSRIQQALFAVAGPGGTVTCQDPSGGCVPLNIFGAGNISQEAADFIRVGATNSTTIEEQVAAASISGDLFELPAGGLGVALGAEWRKEKSAFTPDEFLASGDVVGFNAGEPTAGSFTVKELFGEVLVPILSDLPFVKDLSFEGGLRYSDYSTVGSVWTYKAGGEWSPTDDIRIRGLYQRAVRAPNVLELFSGPSQDFPAYTDPCDAGQGPAGAVADLCVAQGIPRTQLGIFEQANSQVEARLSGNPDLNEEKSDTYTIGAVLTPTFIDDLSITVDYFNIKVKDAVGQFGGGAGNIVSLCFQSLDINSPFCQAFTRDQSGNIDIVDTPNANNASLKTQGLDIQANYALPLDGFTLLEGDTALRFGFLGTYLFDYKFQSGPGLDEIQCAGFTGSPCPGPGGAVTGTGTPEWKHVLSTTLETGPLSMRVQWRFIGSMKDARISTGTPREDVPVPKVGAVNYFDLGFQFMASENLTFVGGVDNLLDRSPPTLGDAQVQANTDPSLYDVLGRRFFVGVTAKF